MASSDQEIDFGSRALVPVAPPAEAAAIVPLAPPAPKSKPRRAHRATVGLFGASEDRTVQQRRFIAQMGAVTRWKKTTYRALLLKLEVGMTPNIFSQNCFTSHGPLADITDLQSVRRDMNFKCHQGDIGNLKPASKTDIGRAYNFKG